MTTLTLDDLNAWQSSGKAPSDPAPRLAVIGDPVAHSLSPAMHQPALDKAGIRAQYVKLHVPASVDSFAPLFAQLRALGFIGVNVTVPHKATALAAADVADDAATAMGAANTILFADDGTTYAFNTDGIGMAEAIRDAFRIDLRDLRIAIVGAGGGAGRAAAVKCALDQCERLVLINRTVSKIKDLETKLRPYFTDDKLHGATERLCAVGLDDPARLAEELEETDLIINATSLGMKPGEGSPLPARMILPHHLVFDMIYAPPKTPLLRAAEGNGARIANGSDMLLHQGAAAFAIWFGQDPDIHVMRNALRDASKP